MDIEVILVMIGLFLVYLVLSIALVRYSNKRFMEKIMRIKGGYTGMKRRVTELTGKVSQLSRKERALEKEVEELEEGRI